MAVVIGRSAGENAEETTEPNGDLRSEALCARLRCEIERRKRVLDEASADGLAGSQASGEKMPRFQRDRGELWNAARASAQRALAKNKTGWPRPLHGLRRNQTAVNTSLAHAVLAILDWTREKVLSFEEYFSSLESRQNVHQKRLAQTEETIRTWENWLARQDGRVTDLERRLWLQENLSQEHDAQQKSP
ncbi:MAG: hypothetical protein ABIR71_06910 [Chthoniobacterales bacterium]